MSERQTMNPRCIDCGESIESYTYRGERKWKHVDDMPHGHAAEPNEGGGDQLMSESDVCECDRPDEVDNPHRHTFDVACVYWLAGRPGVDARRAAAEGRLPLTGR